MYFNKVRLILSRIVKQVKFDFSTALFLLHSKALLNHWRGKQKRF